MLRRLRDILDSDLTQELSVRNEISRTELDSISNNKRAEHGLNQSVALDLLDWATA
jgi:hypothetical protein